MVIPRLPRRTPCNPKVFHQSLHGTAGRGYRLTARLFPDFTSTVVPVTLFPHALNVVAKLSVPPGALTALLWLSLKGPTAAIRGRCNRQFLADRLDTVFVAVRVNKIHPHLGLRSSAAWAKKAAAFFKISWARLSARFSRSSAFMRFD